MEVLGQVLGVAQTIYALCDQASSNKMQCRRLEKRIKMLLMTAQSLEKQPDKSAALLDVVEELATTIDNAKCWVIKYSHRAWWKQVLLANGIKEEFDLVNDCLGDVATAITALLSAEHRHTFSRFFTENTRKKQNEKDIAEDLKELRHYLNSEQKAKLDEISAACRRQSWNITEIRATDLKRGDLLLERATHYLYRGELHWSPVAIKVFKSQGGQSEELIRRTFQSEIQTMKKFECLNVLRLYGICIDNSGPETSFSLVIDLCEKGTLRELLQAEPDLSWDRRAHMALDVARALYRLHQTEAKATLYGNLSSSKYLVDGMYCVKLSGFELTKTESSIRRPTNMATIEKNRELEYIAPETWRDINAYDKRSELYSLGVVMYEIVTGKQPFQGLTVKEDNLGEMQERWWSLVDDDLQSICPVFQTLIKSLLQRSPKDRPSAGVTVGKLMAYLNQQKSEMCPGEVTP